MPATLTVQGELEARQALENTARGLHGVHMFNAMRRATLLLERDAKRNAPVDTGRLRGSITRAVRSVGIAPVRTLQGVVGTNVVYAKFMEEGTGIFAGHSRVKMPPVQALQRWASRHGTSAFVVAFAIFKRGGLEPREYFKAAVDKNENKIVDMLGEGVRTTIARS